MKEPISWPKRAPAQCLGCGIEFPLPVTSTNLAGDIIRCPHCGSSAYRWPPQPRRPSGREITIPVTH